MTAALAPLAQAVFECLYPLAEAAQSADHREHLLRQLGWDEDAAAELFVLGPQFVDWWERGLEHQAALDAAAKGQDSERIFASAMLLLEIAFELSDALAAQQGRPSDGPLQPGVRQALWQDLALALPEYLLLRWLRTNKPLLYWLLRVTDVVELVAVDASQPARVAADVPRLRLERLGALLAQPEAYLKGRYDWGFDAASLAYEFRHDRAKNAPLRHARLLQVLQRLFGDLGLPARLGDVQQRYRLDAAIKAPAGTRQLSVPLVQGRSGSGPWAELGIDLVPIPGSRGPTVVDGLLLTNLARGAKAGSWPMGPGWTLAASGAVDTSGAVGVKLLPGSATLVKSLPASGFELRAIGQPAQPWVLLGGASGTRLELRGAEAGVALQQQGNQVELRLFAEPKAKGGGPGLVLRLAPGEGDGLVKELLGSKELEVVFDLGAEWSSLHGLSITGEAGLCVALPVQLRLGPATLNEVHLCLTAGADGLALMAAVTAEAQLGPVVCSVKDIGVEFRLGWGGGATQGKRFGAVSLEAAFKPPSGVGLGLECPAVRAGGYLELDRECGEYGGTATVGIGPLALTAVGLLDARLPDPPGWSLLLSICAQFTPLPLGFGFTLNGVGGLVGIGRGLDVPALQRSLSAGALDAVMFPEDPVGDGPAIIDTLRELFPVQPGQTVVGPMVKIGWGAPTLIDADLAVLIELPDPVCITLLGQIASELPTAELGIVRLHLDSMGSFNLSTLELSLAASLYDSWMVGLSLSGDMAMRAGFGSTPGFLLSLGGFHPAFEAPPKFPPLKPLSLGIRFDADLQVEARSYFALTPNTMQFGAELLLRASLEILSIEGGAGFDALLKYSPFSFTARFQAHADVRLGQKELLGISIAARLSGPEPWCFNGNATFRVLYKDWRYDVAFQLAGRQAAVPLERIDVAALVRAALCEPGAWTQSGSALPGVRLADTAQTGATAAGAGRLPTLLLHPDLPLELRQRIAPLDITLEKYGEHALAGAACVTVDRVAFGSRVLATLPAIEDWFAPAEYFELSQDEKLEAPAFELLVAGKRLAAGSFAVGSAAERSLAHEVSTLDRELDRKLGRAPAARRQAARQPADDRSARAALARQREARRLRQTRADALPLRRRPPCWQVLDTSSGWSSAAQPSFSAARALLRRRQQEQALPGGRLRVVPVGGQS